MQAARPNAFMAAVFPPVLEPVCEQQGGGHMANKWGVKQIVCRQQQPGGGHTCREAKRLHDRCLSAAYKSLVGGGGSSCGVNLGAGACTIYA
jgi:hypothetical protein